MTIRRTLAFLILFQAALLVGFAAAQEAESGVAESPEMIRQREEWYHQLRAYPLKHIPAGVRVRALRRRQAMEALEEAMHPLASSAWTPIGPEPTIPLLAEAFGGSPNVSGRVTAISVDPTNASIVYIGGADGGVWKTTNGGATWTPLTDAEVSLAIGAIAIDPSNHNIIYAGTGEDNNNQDGYTGAGILKSTDGGATWTSRPGPFVGPLGATTGGGSIGSLAVSPSNGQIVLAGVSLLGADGVYRSTDGGTTWTDVLGGSGFPATGVVFDPTNGNIAFAAIGAVSGNASNGVYKSTDGGATWSALITAGTAPAGRVAIALAPSTPTTLYASFANSTDGSLLGLYKTTDGGVVWNQLPATPNFCNPQCWYDMAIAVAPNNPNVIFGVGAYQYATNSQTTVVRSLDGGKTWAELGGGANGTDVHTDGHAVAFAANSATVYVGSDGGVWSTNNVTASTVNWTSLNSTLALTQFYNGLSIDPTNLNRSFGGAQDNGDQSYTGGFTWNEVAPCGDGGFTAIDPLAPNTVYVTGHGPCVEKSTTGGGLNTFSDVAPTVGTSDRVPFIPAIVIDPTTPSNLYLGTNVLYQTTDSATSWTAISPDLTNGTGTISAIAVAPNNSNTIYTGSNDALVAVTTNALSGTSSSWFNVSTTATRAVTDIKVDPTTSTTAYVTYGGFSGFTDTVGHVFKTTNGGRSWADVSGNLPNIPVTSIAVDPDVANTLYVGTDVGAFFTSNGGTSWSTLGTGLPNVGIMSLTFHHATRTLRAGTHGRSAWDLNLGINFVLTVSEAGTGKGTVTSSPVGINCPGTCSTNFKSGTVVTLTQAVGSGSTFAGWSGACTGTGTCNVTMSAAKSVTATFNTSVTTFPLTVSEAGTTTGTVTSSPTGINCPGTCSANFKSGTVVTLTASAAAGSTFAGWSGACTGTGTCSVTMSAAKSVTATFNAVVFKLSVTKAGTGTGTVTSSPTGISCGTTCSANFKSGTVVTLTASAAAGSTFAGWSGACTGTGTCSVTMSAAKSVTATFNVPVFKLSATKAGTGIGTVTSSPTGISCGATCSANFKSGTVVTLTASAAAGSTFAGWSGACTGTGTCSVTMSAAKSVTATFNVPVFKLSVTKAGTGTGTVTSSPTGISCGTTCSANFKSGTVVTLTASAAAGSTFAGWSGACTGTGTCSVTMSAAKSVTATFNVPVFKLSATKAGTGTGTVTSSPTGISCGTTCSANFKSGTVVTLTASAAAGSTFAGWSGACTGTGTCSVTMSAAKSVTATFNAVVFKLSVTKAGTGTGTVTSSPTGISCGTTCSANFKSGTVVTLTASAAAGSTFTGWSGACTGTGACSVTMSAAKSVTVTFK